MQREQVLRTIYEALGDGDLDAMRPHVRDDVEVVERLDVPGARSYSGVEEWEAGYAREAETIDEFRVELLGVEEIGERCVADVEVRLRGKGSGAEVASRLAHLVDFDGEKASRWRAFSELEEARAAAMKEEVAELYALWARGRLDEAIARVHPDIDWVEPAETIDARRRSGREDARQGVTEWQTSFDSYEGEIGGIEVVNGRVVVDYMQRVRAGGGSVDLESEIFHVWEFRDGRPSRMAMYFDRDQALNS